MTMNLRGLHDRGMQAAAEGMARAATPLHKRGGTVSRGSQLVSTAPVPRSPNKPKRRPSRRRK